MLTAGGFKGFEPGVQKVPFLHARQVGSYLQQIWRFMTRPLLFPLLRPLRRVDLTPAAGSPRYRRALRPA